MKVSEFITALRRGLTTRAAVAGLSAMTLAIMGVSSRTLLHADEVSEPLITNVARFQIPFDVEADPDQPAEGFAVLFGSQDGGRSWQQLQSVPVSQEAFNFSAPRDGRYSFAIRITDPNGNLESAIEGSPPELEVVVDSVPPELSLTLTERASGEVVVNWITTDAGVAPETLAIEYADGADGRWKAAELTPAANGQCVIPVTRGSVVSVRAAMLDLAGNRAEANSQLISKSSTGSTGICTAPTNVLPGQPLGPSPFNSVPGSLSGGMPSGYGSNPAPSEVTAQYPQVSPAAILPGSMLANTPPSNALTVPNMPTEAFGVPAPSPTFAMPSSFQSDAPLALNATAGDMQIVSNRVFDIEYQIEDVGPSGVSAVKLYVTENGGQQWFEYGNDADLRSPFSVDAQGEGTFGFAVRIINGLGFSDTPPQPGHAPEIVVTVDQSAPQVEFLQPVVRTEGLGTVNLTWRISEPFPSSTPVRLEFASTANGPWSPVFDWQADQGGHQLAIRQGMPPAVFFRLLARDAAGNVSVGQTPQPVVVDVKKPVGRLLRVHTASQSTTWP